MVSGGALEDYAELQAKLRAELGGPVSQIGIWDTALGLPPAPQPGACFP
jgi:hypothetical protein